MKEDKRQKAQDQLFEAMRRPTHSRPMKEIKKEIIEDERPFMWEFPENWVTLYAGSGRYEMVKAIEERLPYSARRGARVLRELAPKRKERTTYNTNQGIVFGPKPGIVEKEIDDDAISAILEE